VARGGRPPSRAGPRLAVRQSNKHILTRSAARRPAAETGRQEWNTDRRGRPRSPTERAEAQTGSRETHQDRGTPGGVLVAAKTNAGYDLQMKVFVSYSHEQADWVEDYLVVVLEACGHEVLWDKGHFRAGLGLSRQERVLQDEADVQILCFSPSYLKSKHCMAEMRHALRGDPDFDSGKIVPLVLGPVTLPDEIEIPDPLYVVMGLDRELRGSGNGWELLRKPPLSLDFNVETSRWLEARDKIRRHLERKESINLVTETREPRQDWRSLVRYMEQGHSLGVVDFGSGIAASREYLVKTVLGKAGRQIERPEKPYDLGILQEELEKLGHTRQAWLHFSQNTERGGEYQKDFYSTIRHLVSESKALTLLIHSDINMADWMEKTHKLSKIDFKTVEL